MRRICFIRSAREDPWVSTRYRCGAMILGVLQVGFFDFDFLGFYMTYSKEAKSLTVRRGSEVSQVMSLLVSLNRVGGY